MGSESKAKAAQLSVLSKYGVLADFTDVEEVALDRALKGRLSASASKELTFAHWRDQLLGPGVRLPVARFANPVPGQIRLGKLAIGQDFAASLKSRDRQLQARLKASELEVMRKMKCCYESRLLLMRCIMVWCRSVAGNWRAMEDCCRKHLNCLCI